MPEGIEQTPENKPSRTDFGLSKANTSDSEGPNPNSGQPTFGSPRTRTPLPREPHVGREPFGVGFGLEVKRAQDAPRNHTKNEIDMPTSKGSTDLKGNVSEGGRHCLEDVCPNVDVPEVSHTCFQSAVPCHETTLCVRSWVGTPARTNLRKTEHCLNGLCPSGKYSHSKRAKHMNCLPSLPLSQGAKRWFNPLTRPH